MADSDAAVPVDEGYAYMYENVGWVPGCTATGRVVWCGDQMSSVAYMYENVT